MLSFLTHYKITGRPTRIPKSFVYIFIEDDETKDIIVDTKSSIIYRNLNSTSRVSISDRNCWTSCDFVTADLVYQFPEIDTYIIENG